MVDPGLFDGISTGRVIETGKFRITAEEIKRFAQEFDPQPMHLDETAAKTGPFGRLVASGWQTLNLTMRLMVQAKPFGAHPLVGVAVDSVRFHKPVEPNTSIFAAAKIISKRRSGKQGRGLVKLEVETRDSDTGELLLSQVWTVMLPT